MGERKKEDLRAEVNEFFKNKSGLDFSRFIKECSLDEQNNFNIKFSCTQEDVMEISDALGITGDIEKELTEN